MDPGDRGIVGSGAQEPYSKAEAALDKFAALEALGLKRRTDSSVR
jgi:hypothetical protein